MNKEAYQYNNFIMIKNNVSNFGLRSVYTLLDMLENEIKTKTIESKVNRLTTMFVLHDGKRALICDYYPTKKDISFYCADFNGKEYTNISNIVDINIIYESINNINKSIKNQIERSIKIAEISQNRMSPVFYKINSVIKQCELQNNYLKEYTILNLYPVNFMKDSLQTIK